MASILPLVSELRSPCMRDRHWKAVASECHKPVDKGPGFCLADLLKLQLHEHVEGIMEIVGNQCLEGGLRRFHFIQTTRVHQTRSWVVLFRFLRPFGPRRDRDRRRVAIRSEAAHSGPETTHRRL